MKTMPEIVSEMTAIARKELRTKIQRSRAERKGDVYKRQEEGIDGMIHVSDMSWTRKINHPSEVLKKGDEVEDIVLEIKKKDQRVSLGIKQLEYDPWESINDRFKVGDMVTGQVAKIASFGAFVNLNGDCLLYTSRCV